jgi:hypothetical protein
MTITVDAVYENGVLKPAQPLPLAEHELVQVTVRAAADVGAAQGPDLEYPDSTPPGQTWADRTAGILGWTGSAELAERFATDPELDFPPPAETP